LGSFKNDGEFEEEQKVDRVLMFFCFMMFAIVGYYVTRFLRF